MDCPDPLPPPAPPAEALVHHQDRSKLPPDFPALPLDSALRVLLRAHLFDVQTLEELEVKHKALTDYIDEILRGNTDD